MEKLVLGQVVNTGGSHALSEPCAKDPGCRCGTPHLGKTRARGHLNGVPRGRQWAAHQADLEFVSDDRQTSAFSG